MWKSWRHITKLDPDRPNTEHLVRQVIKSGTDAVMVSGTQGITTEKVSHLLRLLEGCDIPIVLEPAHKDVVTFEVDYVFVPSVLNSGDKWWVIDSHFDWVNHCISTGKLLDWSRVVSEAYIVLNEKSEVARVTEARTGLSMQEVLAYAFVADRLLHYPIVYIEYSGAYGDPSIVKAVKDNLRDAALFYGGGIDSKEKASEMGKYATIIVGNILYHSFERFKETIL
ncbi:MAG: heptaprenylglyceryl phosphate synthase [Candidatus Bathyarchaeia archaeon]